MSERNSYVDFFFVMRLRGSGGCASKAERPSGSLANGVASISLMGIEVDSDPKATQNVAPQSELPAAPQPTDPAAIERRAKEEYIERKEALTAQLTAAVTAAVASSAAMELPRRSSWGRFSGHELAGLMVHTTVISCKWLVAWAESNPGVGLPCWQELPVGASVDLQALLPWRSIKSLPIVIWSYCWLDHDHPDSRGEQLGRYLPVLRAFAAEASVYSAEGDVGVVIDWCSLPQFPRRDAHEVARFRMGLSAINRWYAKSSVTVLMLPELPAPPSLADGPMPHANLRGYDARGWPTFEKHMSAIVKDAVCLLDVSAWPADQQHAADLREVLRACRGHSRPAPVSPPRFAQRLSAAVASGTIAFTAGADLDVVCRQYEVGFEIEMRAADQLFFDRLQWDDSHVCDLAAAIEYALQIGALEECKRLHMADNPAIGDDGLVELARVLPRWASLGFLSVRGCSASATGRDAVMQACKHRGIDGLQHW